MGRRVLPLRRVMISGHPAGLNCSRSLEALELVQNPKFALLCDSRRAQRVNAVAIFTSEAEDELAQQRPPGQQEALDV
jgi:hypothetical protein